jgi:Leucine-rich repeat (LRR) protein
VATIYYIQLGIRTLGPDSFWSCNNLLDLNIWINQIEDVHDLTFALNPKLRRLDMRQNRISTMPRILFFSLSDMRTLNLEQNNLTVLHPDLFVNQWQLTNLNLQFNRIEELPKAVFSSMFGLEQLNMNNNRLSIIHSDSFGILPSLTNASFVNNQINAIDEKFIDNTGLTNIDMRGNICANSNIIDTTPNRGNMKAALSVCFQNYEYLQGGK